MTILVDPGGLGFRIEHIWAFFAVHADGDEGVVSWTTPDGLTMPLIAADEKRLQGLRPLAEHIARVSGKPVQLARFDQRVDLERLGP